MPRPILVVVSGPPGAGKTTLAHALAAALGWPAVCRDEIKERMVAESMLTETSGTAADLDRKTLRSFFHTIGGFLRSGKSLVAEAAFQDRLWRPGLEPLMDVADIRIVRCAVDPELARWRIACRAAEVPSRAAHADAELLGRIARGERPIESWVPIALDVPCLTVETSRDGDPGNPGDPSLPRVLAFVTAESPAGPP